jgi:hypothetical protein
MRTLPQRKLRHTTCAAILEVVVANVSAKPILRKFLGRTLAAKGSGFERISTNHYRICQRGAGQSRAANIARPCASNGAGENHSVKLSFMDMTQGWTEAGV